MREIGTANPIRRANTPPLVISGTISSFVTALNRVGRYDQHGTTTSLFAPYYLIEVTQVNITPFHRGLRPAAKASTHSCFMGDCGSE